MENASKALLIAGGVLIAIIIITMFIMMFNKVANIQKEQEEKTELEQLVAFNAEYEAYNKKVMYGVDVITLINKAAENNKKYQGNANYQIVVEVDGSSSIDIDDFIQNKKETIFTCEKMSYNSLGRICKIEIETKTI